MRTAAQRLAALKAMADEEADPWLPFDVTPITTVEQLDVLIDEWEAERRQ